MATRNIHINLTVTLETPRKGKRIVQRGRAPRPVR